MLLQSLSALYLAPGGSGSVWKYLEALVRLPGVSGRIACGFRTELHFADVPSCQYAFSGHRNDRDSPRLEEMLTGSWPRDDLTNFEF